MRRFPALAAGLALSVALALAGPALAQQAVPGAGAQAAAPDQVRPTVSARDLMTKEERRSFRRQYRQATPEQREQLWAQKKAELEQRAAQRGVVLAEWNPRSRDDSGERREGRRGESMAAAPRGP